MGKRQRGKERSGRNDLEQGGRMEGEIGERGAENFTWGSALRTACTRLSNPTIPRAVWCCTSYSLQAYTWTNRTE